MKLTESTLVLWANLMPKGGSTVDDRFADWCTDALRECMEAAALDFHQRVQSEYPKMSAIVGIYATVDGDRIEDAEPTTERVQAVLAGGPTGSTGDNNGEDF